MDDTIYAYVDSDVINNGKKETKCGWACKLVYNGHEKMKSGRRNGKTSNQMEIESVLMAMCSIKDKSIPVCVFSSSKYVTEILNGRWKIRQDKELWRDVMTEKMRFSHIEFELMDNRNRNHHIDDVYERAKYEAELAGI